MKNFRVFVASFLPLLLVVTLLTGKVEAVLLDVGPVVPEVNLSTEPDLGHGFPLWYRDTNRIPLQLCTDRNSGMCLTAEPFPGLAQRFPDNMGDELFWWVGDAQITTIPNSKKAILVQAIEAAFATGDVVSGAQISFARIRIRFDPLPAAGEYIVTTPYKTFVFNVAADALEINHTEDLGISEGGIFTGALGGSIGPFLYCKNANQRPAGYIGNPNVPCEVLGSTYPSAQNPTNYFRIQGPNGFDHSTPLFSVMGKLYTEPLPTPLAVEKVTYTRDALGAQVSGFATTQALSNQTVPTAAFPANYALTGAASSLQVVGAGLPTVDMVSNSPADGKFFGSTGLFTDPVSFPETVSVSNTSDIPPTTKVVTLTDEVVVQAAMYDPGQKTLTVSATSYDMIGAPALSLYLPGIEASLGTLLNGQISVTFPITDNTVNPVKTYQIPPATVKVVSANKGSGVQSVVSLPPGASNNAPVAVNDAVDVPQNGAVTIDVAANDTDQNPNDLVVAASVRIATGPSHGTATVNTAGAIVYTPTAAYLGTDSLTYTIRDGFGAVSNIATVNLNVLDSTSNTPPVAVADLASTPEDTAVTFSVVANDTDADNNLLPGSIVFTSNPPNGTLRANSNGSVTFTPAANFTGDYTFAYTVKDSLAAVSDAASATVTVTPVNDAPKAVNDAATTSEGQAVTFSVTANDSDPDGAVAPGSVAVVIQPANGTVTTDTNGSATYTPVADFFGIDTFTYTVSDGTALSNPATVTVTVNSVNDAPIANNDVATVPADVPILINVVGNDQDIDGTINAGSIEIVSQPAGGTVTVNPAGTVSYRSNVGFNGNDTFTYTVRDNSGAVSQPATVSVSVSAAASEAVTVLRAQYRASTREWRVDGVITTPTSTSVNVYLGRDLTGTQLGSTTVATDGTWVFRLNGAPTNPQPNASNTISVQGLPGGGSRLAFPLAVR